MASVKQTLGTTRIWADSAQSPTYNLTLSALANGNGQSGVKGDFGTPFPERVRIQLVVTFASSPTAGTTVDVYWSSSHDDTDYDGECPGTDSAYNSEDDMKRLHYVGSLVASADTNVQQASWIFFLPSRYGLPVVSNQSGQALATDTANHHLRVTELVGDIT